jgi:ABC-type sugar transport system substrate-binding protein
MKKNVLRVMALMVALFMLIVAAGCQKDSNSANDAADTKNATTTSENSSAKENTQEKKPSSSDNIEVSLLVKKLSSSFWVDIENGVKDACAELGWTLRETLCPITPDSNEEQIELLEQDLLDPPDLYILCPADSKGIAPAIEQINKAGVPIINVNTRIDGEGLEVVSFVGVDCRQIAGQVAEAMAKEMNYKGNIVILQGTTGSQTGIDYYEGAVEVYEKYKDIVILDSQVANYQRQEGMTVTQNLLQKYDNIDAIHACNLEMALGAAVACEQAGRTNILICGINMSDEGAKALKDGKLGIIADDNPYNVAYTSIYTAKDYFDGKDVPENVICPATMVLPNTDVAQSYYDRYGIK